MKIKTTRYMYGDKVRRMCSEQGYCTKCDNEQFESLIKSCTGEVSDERVLHIAEKIFEYTDIENFMLSVGLSEAVIFEGICWQLFNRCTITNVELD